MNLKNANGENVGNKILIGIIISVVAGIIVTATAWNFNAVAGFPDKYVTKIENSTEHKQINKKLDKIYDLIIRLHTHEGELKDESMQIHKGR